MIESNYQREFEKIAEYYEKSGGDASRFLRRDIVSIIVSGDKVIGRNTVEGVELKAKGLENGVEIWLEVKDGIQVENPIHLCTGYLKPEGTQLVLIHTKLGKAAKANFLSHCVFPNGKEFTHRMISDIELSESAKMSYEDVHFHSKDGGVTVEAIYNAHLSEKSVFRNTFHLTKTRVGKLKVEMKVNLDKEAVAEIESKVYEKQDDYVEIIEELNLNGERSSGIAKSVVFATDSSKARIINRAYGNAPYARGHIECKEIVKGGNVNVGTIPELYVKDEKAELTHEASIGRMNVKQLETLMAKGLTENEAIELIVKGMLK
ncbi:MAG: SufD family Fe-S cluster assembly protein [Kosmotoga sp.]|nr:SufD family Fe-S cluster assembly protein [Kosmotoga sp.]MBO8167095.1 SufD family Fe-S cluster assembly protein [Kosmotoga sp.]